jgi:pyridoxal phosphate enzyme (YggS family)
LQHKEKGNQMPVNEIKYQEIVKQLAEENVTLVAVSKTKPVEDIEALYQLGQLDFGENYVQELAEKQSRLTKDIRWHFIGHLQTNKVKHIIPFVHLIHSVDSMKLLQEINKQAKKVNKLTDCLLQVHIAQEETKFGMDEQEIYQLLDNISQFSNIRLMGLMGMASLTDDEIQVRNEYKYLSVLYATLKAERTECSSFSTLSMGMSSDYTIAIEEGSNLIRVGSLLFGQRN